MCFEKLVTENTGQKNISSRNNCDKSNQTDLTINHSLLKNKPILTDTSDTKFDGAANSITFSNGDVLGGVMIY